MNDICTDCYLRDWHCQNNLPIVWFHMFVASIFTPQIMLQKRQRQTILTFVIPRFSLSHNFYMFRDYNTKHGDSNLHLDNFVWPQHSIKWKLWFNDFGRDTEINLVDFQFIGNWKIIISQCKGMESSIESLCFTNCGLGVRAADVMELDSILQMTNNILDQ